jgi:hypothetical protein
MRKSSKAALIAGSLLLCGAATLMFSPGAGRVPLGSMLIGFGLINAFNAFRLRAAAN